AGGIWEKRKSDHRRAIECHEKALESTLGFVPSARILADVYYKNQNWEGAERCAEIVATAMDPSCDRKALSRLRHRLGYITEKLHEFERAVGHYRASHDLEPGNMEVMEGLTGALVKLERWGEAADSSLGIVKAFGSELSDVELSDLYMQAGTFLARIGRDEEAVDALAKVIKLDDRNVQAMKALLELREKRGEYEEAYDLVSQMSSIAEGDERLELLMKLGSISRDRLDDPYRAIDAYTGALESVDDEVRRLPAMEALCVLFRKTLKPQKAADLIRRIVEIETDPARLAVHWGELAVISRDELGDGDGAIEAFNRVLDCNPFEAKAFIAIEAILAARKDWKRLEENYRAMIQRLPKEAVDKRQVLWRSMGELYRRALKNTDAAIMAYEVVQGYDNRNVETLETLADLYTGREKYRTKALKAHHELVRVSSSPVKSCRALRNLYLATKEYDKVLCICSALEYLGEADEFDAKLLAQLRPKAKEAASRPASEQLWEEGIFHPQARSAIGAVMAYLHRNAADLFAQDVEMLGVQKKAAIDTAQSQLFFVKMFKYAQRALGLGDVLLYRAPAGVSGLRTVGTSPISVVAGEDMFGERPRRDAWFLLARELTFARPEFAIPASLPQVEMNAVWNALLSLVSPSGARDVTSEPVARWRTRMAGRLSPDQLTTMKALLSGHLGEKGPGLMEFIEGVEYTSLRAGFALSGDLGQAISLSQSTPSRLAKPAFRSVVRELVMYSVSEGYFELRSKMGLAVQI
ncbi:MAG: tetratricopeptide repeat protein, partial [Myxococcota bacterium]